MTPSELVFVLDRKLEGIGGEGVGVRGEKVTWRRRRGRWCRLGGGGGNEESMIGGRGKDEKKREMEDVMRTK